MDIENQQQPANAESTSAAPVTYFGDPIIRDHSKNNQSFINEYEVCV